MDIVKKNILSIIFAVVAILAVVANFYPMGGKRTALKEEASQHASKAGELRSLLTKQRNLPTVKPGDNTVEQLPTFPTHQALEEAHKATDLVNKAADALSEKASTDNKHTPLVDRALPGQPGDTLPASAFARAYVSMFPPPAPSGGIPVAPPPTTRVAGMPPSLMEILHGGMPPTDFDLAAARDAKQKQIEGEAPRDNRNQVVNPDQLALDITNAFKSLNEDMRTDRAKKCKVYIAPDAFSIYPGMIIGAQPQPSDIFWAQIALWVQEDVCHSIDEMIPDTMNVMDAPVKQLVKIAFVNANQPNAVPVVGPVATFLIPNLPTAGGVGNGAPEMTPMANPAEQGNGQPAAQPFDPNPDLTKTRNTILSPSGRISNGMFDVVQFDVELVVDAGSVSEVLQGLGAKRYISVIQVQSIDSVDSAFMRGGGYYFGTKPCVRVKARCEELFFRSWLQNYVPARLKTMLQYAAPPSAAPPA